MPFHVPQLPLHEPAWVFGLVTLVVLISPILSRWLRLPEVVVLVLAGTVIGAGGLGLLERDGAIALVGSIGLLYLMFTAGLELDVEEFAAHQRDSWLFGGLTFIFPLVLGAAGALLFDYGWLAAILIGSCWASHTLVPYSTFQRFNAVRHKAVSTTVGATIITDTAALLVLAVVAGMHQGEVGPGFWVGLLTGGAAVAALGTIVLPRFGRWFFAGLGQDQTARFFFLMVSMALMAGLAEMAGIEAIVGAFLAGLTLNRLVPKEGPLMDRVDFLGSRVLVPIFLISVGMLIDPVAIVSSSHTLLLALTLTAAAVISKLIAAWVAGKLLHYRPEEIGAMFGLSVNQAAATLAAIIVGVNVGLIDEATVRAVVLVILVTCILGSWASARYAPRLVSPPRKLRPLGEKVVVPIANPATAEYLVAMAAEFCLASAGSMVPLTVVDADVTHSQLEKRRKVNADAEAMARAKGIESHGLVRIDASPALGTLHTVVEYEASLVVLGWKGHAAAGENLFGSIIDEVLTQATCPVIVARLTHEPYQRVLLSVRELNLSPAGTPSLRRAFAAARVLTKAAPSVQKSLAASTSRNADSTAGTEQAATNAKRLAPDVSRGASKPPRTAGKLFLMGDVDLSRLAKVLEMDHEDLTEMVEIIPDQRRPFIAARQHAQPNDLVIVPSVPTYPSVRVDAARVVRTREDCSVLVVADGSSRPTRQLAHVR